MSSTVATVGEGGLSTVGLKGRVVSSISLVDAVESRPGSLRDLKELEGASLAYSTLDLSGTDLSRLRTSAPSCDADDYPFVETVVASNSRLTDEGLEVLLALPSLFRVDVNDNSLTGEVAKAGEPCTSHATHVQANRNQLSSLGRFGQLRFLRSLAVSNNRLQSLADLGDKPLLADVDASHNRLTSLRLRVPLQTLASLDVSSNQLGPALSELPSLPSLRKLHANDNLIETAVGLATQPRLAELSLTGNRLAVLSELDELCRAAPNLARLDLRGNPVAALPNYRETALHVLRGLEWLDGTAVAPEERVNADETFGDLAAAEKALFRRVLPRGAATTELSLAAFALAEAELADAAATDADEAAGARGCTAERGPAPLAADAFWDTAIEFGLTLEWQGVLATAPAALDRIDLSGRVPAAGDAGLWAAAKLLAERPAARELSLRGALRPGRWSAALSDAHGLRRVAEVCAAHAGVSVVDLSNCAIGAREAPALVPALRLAPSLRVVDLRDNRLGEHTDDVRSGTRAAECPGLWAVVGALAARGPGAGLTVDLSNCGLADEATARCVSELPRSGAVAALRLSSNDLGGAEGGAAFAAALRAREGPAASALASLSLESCQASFLEPVLYALSHHGRRGLAELNLSGSALSLACTDALSYWLRYVGTIFFLIRMWDVPMTFVLQDVPATT